MQIYTFFKYVKNHIQTFNYNRPG